MPDTPVAYILEFLQEKKRNHVLATNLTYLLLGHLQILWVIIFTSRKARTDTYNWSNIIAAYILTYLLFSILCLFLSQLLLAHYDFCN